MPLSCRLLPARFVSGHTRWVREVHAHIRPGCHWLDAGGGRKVFDDPEDNEAELVARAGRVIVVDANAESLAAHRTVTERVCASLDSLPFPDSSFDIITLGMVAEHLAEPVRVFRELARVLRPGGRLLIHTVNRWGYPTLLASASRFVPFRRRIIALVTGREESDIFPAYYRANTAGSLTKLAADAGLTVERLEHWHSGFLFGRVRVLPVLESLFIRLISDRFACLRAQLFAVLARSHVPPGTFVTTHV